MDYLAEAKKFADYANTRKLEWAQVNAQVATAHGIIALVEQMNKAIAALTAIAERLPPPAETWSEAHVRLQKEKHNGV